MSKTIEEVSNEPKQAYREGIEAQKAFSPRYDVQETKTLDATRDLDLLLGAKAQKTQQEYGVSVGMAKTIAVDHITSLEEEIGFIDRQLKPGESRDVAIKRLQSSIASTSGVTAGLSGDAAQAYDETYIRNARSMASGAINKWTNEQVKIDQNRVKNEFDKFISTTYTNLPPDGAQELFGLWKGRLTAIDPKMALYADEAASDAVVGNIIATATKDPTKNPTEIAGMFRDKNFFGQVTVDSSGLMEFSSSNVSSNAKISSALYRIFEEETRFKAQNTEESVAEYRRQEKEATKAKKLIFEAYDMSNPEERKIALELAAKIDAPFSKTDSYDFMQKGDNSNPLVDFVTGRESGGNYNVWNGGTSFSRAGKINPKTGAEYSSAFGRYQFVEKTAQDVWNKAQAAGLIPADKIMIHGKQTKEEQDAMWKVQENLLRSAADDLGIEATNGNLYMIHQLGKGGAGEVVRGKISDETRNNMYANLPQAKRSVIDSGDTDAVKRAWLSTYMKTDDKNVNMVIKTAETIQELTTAVAVKNGLDAERKAAAKADTEKVKEADKLRSEGQAALAASLEKLADAVPTQENYDEVIGYMLDVNYQDSLMGNDPTYNPDKILASKNLHEAKLIVEESKQKEKAIAAEKATTTKRATSVASYVKSLKAKKDMLEASNDTTPEERKAAAKDYDTALEDARKMFTGDDGIQFEGMLEVSAQETENADVKYVIGEREEGRKSIEKYKKDQMVAYAKSVKDGISIKADAAKTGTREQRTQVELDMIAANKENEGNNEFVQYNGQDIKNLRDTYAAYDKEKEGAEIKENFAKSEEVWKKNGDKPLSKYMREEYKNYPFTNAEAKMNAASKIRRQEDFEARTLGKSSVDIAAEATKGVMDNGKYRDALQAKKTMDQEVWEDKGFGEAVRTYEKSDAKKVNDALESPIANRVGRADFAKKEDYDKVISGRTAQMVKLYERAVSDDKDSTDKLKQLFSDDATLAASYDQINHFAKSIIGTATKDINVMQKQMQSAPWLYRNKNFIGGAKLKMSETEKVKYTVMSALIAANQSGKPFDQKINDFVDLSVKQSYFSDAYTDLSDETTAYSKSEYMEDFIEEMIDNNNIPESEKAESLMAARALDHMQQGPLIKEILGGITSRYEKNSDLGGIFSNGTTELLLQSGGDPATLTALIMHDISFAEKTPKNRLTELSKQVMNGEYIVSKDGDGVTRITFRDDVGKFSIASPRYTLAAEKLKVVNNPNKDKDIVEFPRGEKYAKGSRAYNRELGRWDAIEIGYKTKEEMSRPQIEQEPK